MLKNEKKEIVDVFKRNIQKYISQEDLQEVITSITYLFWNAKYVMKNDFTKELTIHEVECLLK